MQSAMNALNRPDTSVVCPPTTAPGAVAAGGARAQLRTPQAIVAANKRRYKEAQTKRFAASAPHKRAVAKLPAEQAIPAAPLPVIEEGHLRMRGTSVARGLALACGGVFYHASPQAGGRLRSSNYWRGVRDRAVRRWVGSVRESRSRRQVLVANFSKRVLYRKKNSPVGLFDLRDPGVFNTFVWNRYWNMVVMSQSYPMLPTTFPCAVSVARSLYSPIEAEPSAAFFHVRRELAIFRIKQVCKKYIKRRFRVVNLYKKQDIGVVAFVVAAVIIVAALLLFLRRYEWQAELIWGITVMVLVLGVLAWRALEYGRLQHLNFFGLSGRFEYGDFGSTWEYSAIRGRSSNFYGSGYVSCETRVVRSDIISEMMNEHLGTAVTTTTARSCRQVAMHMLEPELRAIRLRNPARYESLIRLVHWSALYVCQTLELMEVQTSDRTSSKTRSALVDQDFTRRGGSGAHGRFSIRTVLGRPPPSL